MWYLHVIGSTKSRGQGDDGVRDRSTLFLPPTNLTVRTGDRTLETSPSPATNNNNNHHLYI